MPAFLVVFFSPIRRSMTPKGQPPTQYPQPLQTSSCTTTVPNSVRNSAPVGQTLRQPALVQCLQTLDAISHRNSVRSPASGDALGRSNAGILRSTSGLSGLGGAGFNEPKRSSPLWLAPAEKSLLSSPSSTSGPTAVSGTPMVIPVSSPANGLRCSMNSTWRQVLAPSA